MSIPRLTSFVTPRVIAYGGVALLGAFTFFTSYQHIYDLVTANGQHGAAARLSPLSVDLLIVVATAVIYLLKRADATLGWFARKLPRFLLWGGIVATVAANVASGWSFGPLGAVSAGWPGLVFAGVVEMVLVSVIPASREPVKQTVKPAGQAGLPATSYDLAVASYLKSVEGQNPLSDYELDKRFGIGRSKGRRIVAQYGPKPPAGASVPPPDQTAPAGSSLALSNGSHDG